jgi:penicillin-binding protein 2
MALDLEYTKGGIDTFKSYTDIFGIGRKTGVDLPGENSGAMPSKELKRQVYNETWYVGDLCNTSIGQGLLSATPLQMTVATAAIENGGRVLKPKLVNRFEDNNGEVIKKEESEVVENLNIEQKNLDIIKNAMKGVVRDPNGTGGKLSFVKDYLIAKTGTATAPVTINGIRYNQPHAWVTGVFEKDGRKYAFTANIAHGGWGEVSVDVMKEFFEQIYQ